MKNSVNLSQVPQRSGDPPGSASAGSNPESVAGPLAHEELAAAFEACSLPPADFGHAEHLRLAWTYLERDPPLIAAARLCAGLRRYTRAIGVAGKYHETLTLAWLFLVHERRRRGGDGDWPAFRRANPDLFDPGARPLEAWYRPQTLRSPRARRRFVLPDLGTTGPRGKSPGAPTSRR